jgi:hypothetical protein
LYYLGFEEVKIRTGRVQHDIRPCIGQDLAQALGYGQAQGMSQVYDLADVPASFGRINVHTADQLQPSAPDDVARHRATDGPQAILNHSNAVWHG